jgi:CRISPR/Cas system CSM-associated protein Csm3 (group 7 of RAMP superfamily)
LRFEGHITGTLACFPIDDVDQSAPTYSLLLLLAGLRLVDQLGGNKSTGKGQCKCEITKLEVENIKYEHEKWEEWFEKLDELSFYSSAVEGSEA